MEAIINDDKDDNGTDDNEISDIDVNHAMNMLMLIHNHMGLVDLLIY